MAAFYCRRRKKVVARWPWWERGKSRTSRSVGGKKEKERLPFGLSIERKRESGGNGGKEGNPDSAATIYDKPRRKSFFFSQGDKEEKREEDIGRKITKNNPALTRHERWGGEKRDSPPCRTSEKRNEERGKQVARGRPYSSSKRTREKGNRLFLY